MLIELKFYLVSTFVVAGIWVLPSAAITLIYGVLRYPNFAIVQYMTVGAYTCNALTYFLPFWLAAIIAILGTALVAAMLDQFAFRPVRKAGILPPTLLSLGMMLLLENAVRFVWGNDVKQFDLPIAEPLRFGGLVISTYQLITLFVAAVTIGLVHLFFVRTRFGKAIRATANNPDLALTVGIQPETVYFAIFLISGAMAALGGILFALNTSLSPLIGWTNLVPLFSVAILGGLGNFVGTALAAIVMAAVSEFSLLFLSASYKSTLAFVVLALVLFFRPRGILKGEY